MSPADLVSLLTRHRFRYASETELQDSIAIILEREKIQFQREFPLTPRDRIDFLLEGGVGLEVKTKGSPTEVTSQLLRYAKWVESLILVTDRIQLIRQPAEIGGKPLKTVPLLGGIR